MLRSRRARVVAAVVATPLALVLGLLGYRLAAREALRAQTAIATAAGIESLEPVELGGVEQWVLIRGADRGGPVLLWLHGGPGQPTMPYAHRYDGELVKRFVVVHWDQRGAGKSFSPELRPEQLTTDQLIADTRQLAELLRARFGVAKIYLLGHSWGSELGALTVARYPELFHAFIAVGQAVSTPEGYTIAYPLLLDEARRRGEAGAVSELEQLGPPPYTTLEQLTVFGKWREAFGGNARLVSTGDLAGGLLLSPAYTLGDIYRYTQGTSFSVGAMLAQVDAVDLRIQAPRLAVPYYLLHGRHDLAAPAQLAEAYFEQLEAPSKTVIWFERSAHFPMWEEPEQFKRALLRVLEETGG